MPQVSDRNYASVTRLRKPFSTSSIPPPLLHDPIPPLPADDIQVERFESVVAPLLEEGELDADAVVSSSSAAAQSATERHRREEGWNDLGLDVHRQNNNN